MTTTTAPPAVGTIVRNQGETVRYGEIVDTPPGMDAPYQGSIWVRWYKTLADQFDYLVHLEAIGDLSIPADTTDEALEFLRFRLRTETISQGELLHLQGLAEHISSSDVELLEAASVPEDVYRFLNAGGYASIREWMRDSDYTFHEEGDEIGPGVIAESDSWWATGPLRQVDPLDVITGAIEASEAAGPDDHHLLAAYLANVIAGLDYPQNHDPSDYYVQAFIVARSGEPVAVMRWNDGEFVHSTRTELRAEWDACDPPEG